MNIKIFCRCSLFLSGRAKDLSVPTYIMYLLIMQCPPFFYYLLNLEHYQPSIQHILNSCIKEYLKLCSKTQECTWIKHVLTLIINYLHIYISFAIINQASFTVVLREYNQLQSYLRRITQR
jgi:hypothetical protein